MRSGNKNRSAVTPARSRARLATKAARRAPKAPAATANQKLDRVLDQELEDTFPASDPLPWSHEVK
ncbi:MAG TPA: hypothetical protein VGL28_05410 [Steroidobacteraceae bacterium]|jgi:hypothetical protein